MAKSTVLETSLMLAKSVLKDSNCVCERCTELRLWVQNNTKETTNENK